MSKNEEIRLQELSRSQEAQMQVDALNERSLRLQQLFAKVENLPFSMVFGPNLVRFRADVDRFRPVSGVFLWVSVDFLEAKGEDDLREEVNHLSEDLTKLWLRVWWLRTCFFSGFSSVFA